MVPKFCLVFVLLLAIQLCTSARIVRDTSDSSEEDEETFFKKLSEQYTGDRKGKIDDQIKKVKEATGEKRVEEMMKLVDITISEGMKQVDEDIKTGKDSDSSEEDEETFFKKLSEQYTGERKEKVDDQIKKVKEATGEKRVDEMMKLVDLTVSEGIKQVDEELKTESAKKEENAPVAVKKSLEHIVEVKV